MTYPNGSFRNKKGKGSRHAGQDRSPSMRRSGVAGASSLSFLAGGDYTPAGWLAALLDNSNTTAQMLGISPGRMLV